MSEEMQWQKQEGTGAPSHIGDEQIRQRMRDIKQQLMDMNHPMEIIPPQFRLSDEDKAWIRQMIHEEIRAALDDEERVEARIVTRG